MPRPTDPISRTNWSSLTVGQMWDMIKVPAQKNADWDQALALQRISELVDFHQDRLQTYRSKLAAGWPPHPGSASAVFMQQVDALVTSLGELRDAAAANGPALIQITSSIAVARQRLAPVYERWAANEQKLAAYGGRSAAPRPGLPTPMPSPGISPVPAGEQDRLHAEAVSIMTSLSTSTIESRNAFRNPPPYQPPSSGPPEKGEGGRPLPNPPGPNSSAKHLNVGTPADRDNPTTQPVLAGSIAPPVAMPSPGTVGPPVGPGSPSAQSPGVPPFVVPSAHPPLLDQALPGLGARPSSSRWAGSASGRALPPGGVIGGGSPEAFETRPAIGPESVAPIRKVNGVGGMLGGAPEGEQLGGMPFGMAGGAGARSQSGRRMRFDPDTVWEVAEGVPPVLQPGPEVTIHDPGPFIGPR